MARQCFYYSLAVINIGSLLVDLSTIASSFINFICFRFPHID